jgi:hypothetical protein
MTGASTALDGEKYNRQLHRQEIAWIKKNAAAFARANGMSQKDAQMLLTISALGLVDKDTARYLDKKTKNGQTLHTSEGDITAQQIHNAQNYIKGHTVASDTYHEVIDDQPQNSPHSMFEATKYEYEHHDYDPNTPKGGLIDNSLDFVPGGTLVRKGGKAGSDALKALEGKIDDALTPPRIHPLDGTEATLEDVRRGVSTAKDYQSKEPRTLHEQLTIEEVKANPEIGEVITDSKGNSLNNDPLFHEQDGFIKKSHKHQLPDGEKIDIHYQHHPESGNIYDIKVYSPRRNPIQPGASIKDTK